jgi:hypothetical protein
VHFADAEARLFETIAKVRAILAHEIARRRDETHVPAAADRFFDRDAEHHFGLTGAGRRFEQKLEFAIGELLRDLVDGFGLVFGQLEFLARLNEIVREGDGVFVLFDALPKRTVGGV